MASNFDYFTMSAPQTVDCQDWSESLPTWEISPDTVDVPMWQYTNLANQPLTYSYFNNTNSASPILSYSQPIPSIPSATPSPNKATYLDEPRLIPSARTSPFQESADGDLDDDDDSEYSWGANSEVRGAKKSLGKKHELANKTSVKNAKKAHTVVERNYRERLNDKIADLGLYLFETSDSRTKPSKSLVMTRAKERLQQLEARNKSLENEVMKLRQHIAILEHVKSEKQ